MLNAFNRPSLLLVAIVILSFLTTGCENADTPLRSWENAVKGTYSAALSSNGELSIIGSITHGGSLWQTTKGERLYDWNHQSGEYTNIIACAFSPDGNFALTADHQTMVLWSTTTGRALTFWTAPSEVLAVDLTLNGNYALLGLGNYSVVLFDVKRGGIQRTFYHENRVLSVALTENGQFALSGSEDQTAKLWDLSADKAVYTWQHEDAVVTVALSPLGDKALTVAKYDKAVIWNTQSGKAIGELPLHSSALKRGLTFTSAAFSHDGKWLLTGSADRTVQLWDAEKLIELQRWILPKRDRWNPTSAAVDAVGFSDRQNVFYAIAANGLTHQLQR